MATTFLQEDLCLERFKGFSLSRYPALMPEFARKLLKPDPDTKYIRKQNCHMLYSANIHKNIFSSKNQAEKQEY